MTTTPSIALLPENVQLGLSSAHDINSYEHVVEGLIRNALDADATFITIEVDFAKGYISIRDDGAGINSPEFSEAGHLAKPNCTSKFDSQRLSYGSHGRFLSNLSSLSLLSIASRHLDDELVSRLVLHRGQVICRQVRLNIEDGGLDGRGTHVEVRNLFGDVPVRLKHMAVRYSNEAEVDKTFDRLKLLLVGYLLARPGGEKLRVALKCGKRRYLHQDPERENCHTTSLKLVTTTLYHANYLASTSTENWRTLSLVTSKFAVRAAIALEPAPVKTCQFISLEQFPLLREDKNNWMLDVVNDIISSSSFGAVEDTLTSQGMASGPRKVPVQQPAFGKYGKGVDRWPMFYIRVEIKDNTGAALMHPSESLELDNRIDHLVNALETLTYQFLEDNGFRRGTRGRRRGRLLSSAVWQKNLLGASPEREFNSACPRRGSDGSTLRHWHRVKSGRGLGDEDMSYGLGGSKPVKGDQPAPESLGSIHHINDRIDSQDATSNQNSISNTRGETQFNPHVSEIGEQDEGERPILWINPRNGQPTHVHPRTGARLPNLDGYVDRSLPLHPPSGSLGSRLAPKRAITATLEPQSEGQPTMTTRFQKYKGFLDRRRTEKPIISITTRELAPSEGVGRNVGISNICSVEGLTLTKEALAAARIIGQVDYKFVLAVIPSDDKRGNLLALVDQHAADERVKYERLCQDICGTASTTLVTPLMFDIDENEAELFEQQRGYFQRWCVTYTVREGRSVNGGRHVYCVEVSALPTLIAERCRSEPKLLIDLLRSGIWSRRGRPPGEASSDVLTQQRSDEGTAWFSDFAHCPTLMIEMLKSRSCRTAIMFNDELSLEECTQLVRRLSQCTLPFQCAHGRPTLSVTVMIDEDQDFGFGGHEFTEDTGSSEQLEFGAAWGNWTGSG
ncbi:DNA mismatch repair protein [Exophiala xenobiotica]|uniref:DNA mismatch repair protein n=1 Tax=Vermiconidia calcicola TaxID=1690605 RepID=A0AAV9PYD0_9PEZI|nr:DNA mismatch repair protein [Exophiala xenobiotica]KAK5530372.1 DNA mismatch repair protein [Vermiconidia calcicola]KAK5532653.1 DNA mismatch repair protein [Chaetothyriales sp. CCFEE 6169]KAK5293562.1 DNA mismatch repair protein [Exophiala xenobiotica]KAK5425931.1 DNA mismatch repair protein [Exophiala xenobiotica]